MSVQRDEKLNRLQRLVPEGVAIPSRWLTANGYSPQLVARYVRSGWLEPLGKRVYARPGSPVTWEGVMLGLQRLGGLPWHLGGVTALNRQGLAHYLSLEGDATSISGVRADCLPGWSR